MGASTTPDTELHLYDPTKQLEHIDRMATYNHSRSKFDSLTIKWNFST